MQPPMQLKLGDTLLGTLVVDGGDMPWWHGRFQPTSDFEPIRPAFDAWSQAVRERNETAMESAFRALKTMELVVISPDDEPITRFILYIDDDRFRLRY